MNEKGDLISKQAVDDVIYDYSRSCDVDYAQIMEYIDKLPSADIMECARAIKEYCVNRVSHNPTMCDRCPIYKVMCEPDISCPYHWDLPEGEKGGAECNN